MRIALVTETFPPDVNGVARTLSTLVRGLAARDHWVEVVRPAKGRDDLPRADEHGVQHVPVPGAPLPRYPGLRFGLPAGGRLRRRWQQGRPGVVHVATEGPLGWTALRAAQGLGIPVTSSFHTNFHDYGRHYGYRFLGRGVLAYLRWIHNRTACTMVPSDTVCEALADRDFANLTVVGRGVDTELFTPERRDPELRRAWDADGDAPVAGYVGRIAEEKNIGLAVRAFLALRREAPRARLVLVGDGPAREDLAARHPELIFCGMRLGEDLAAHYASADFFLFPSLTETFGNVVTEAMASGLPPVGFDYAALALHVVDGVNGLKAPVADEEAFTAAACRMARDSELRASLGPAARKTALGLSWEAVVDRFEERLRAAAEGAPGSG